MPVLRPIVSRVVIAALVAAPTLASAQPSSPPPVLLPEQSVAVNPLAIPFGVFSAEYEAALPTPGFTLGVGGTYYSNDGDRDAWVEVKGLYYPSESQFRGFSIGLSLGIHSARNVPDCGLFSTCGDGARVTQTAPTLGVLASYDWLLGRAERFRVGLGGGAKRVLRNVGKNDALSQVYPDGRFVVGVVF